MPVITAGFPRPPEDPLYCCPTLYHSTEEKIKKEVNIAFNNFKSLVYSDGIIVAQTENLIAINCAGTNGMSGGPILRKFPDRNKLIGIYVGGPPLPGVMKKSQHLFRTNKIISSHTCRTFFFFCTNFSYFLHMKSINLA